MAGRARVAKGEGGRLRDEILQAATTLLVAHGDERSLSIRDVTGAVGVTPPSLYRHFADKDVLLGAVVLRLHEELDAAIADALGAVEDADPAVRIHAVAQAFASWAMAEPGRFGVLYEGRPAWPTGPGDAIPGRRLLEAVAQDVARVVPGLGADGSFALATRLWCLLHGLVSLRIHKPSVPWPSLEAEVRDGVAALLALPRGG